MSDTNFIIETLKEEIERLNPDGHDDYKSGFNDGAYSVWRYLFEPTSIPPEVRKLVEEKIANVGSIYVQKPIVDAGNQNQITPNTDANV